MTFDTVASRPGSVAFASMDHLTTALRRMTHILNWIRLALACAAFGLAFHVTHHEPRSTSSSPRSEAVARLAAQSVEFSPARTPARD
jgi:hypothetical protein